MAVPQFLPSPSKVLGPWFARLGQLQSLLQWLRYAQTMIGGLYSLHQRALKDAEGPQMDESDPKGK